jgi:hypothetical protein
MTSLISPLYLLLVSGRFLRPDHAILSDQGILLIFSQYTPHNRCFEALKGNFQGQNCPHKKQPFHRNTICPRHLIAAFLNDPFDMKNEVLSPKNKITGELYQLGWLLSTTLHC